MWGHVGSRVSMEPPRGKIGPHPRPASLTGTRPASPTGQIVSPSPVLSGQLPADIRVHGENRHLDIYGACMVDC
jgi:hypothetical protein